MDELFQLGQLPTQTPSKYEGFPEEADWPPAGRAVALSFPAAYPVRGRNAIKINWLIA
jgi:hypothetical protein